MDETQHLLRGLDDFCHQCPQTGLAVWKPMRLGLRDKASGFFSLSPVKSI